MERPEIKPVARMFGMYLNLMQDAISVTSSPKKISKLKINQTETEESSAGANEFNCFRYDVYVDLYSGDKHVGMITADDFKAWFVLEADLDGLWRMNSEIVKVCAEWAKFLRCEERDLKEYERLKKKFK